jgi:signal recognition particle GTPase
MNDNYDAETFVLPEPPSVDTPAEPTEVEQVSSTNPDPIVEEPEVTPQEPVKDNDTVRYEYWQSEAAKLKAKLAEYERKPEPSQEDAPPVPPTTNDPIDNLNYSIAVSNYNLKQTQKIQEQLRQAESKKEELEKQQAVRQYTIAKLTEVTKSPQKSQNIVNFFANSTHLSNPEVYNVMYDAAMNHLNGKVSTTVKKAPPPPMGGESGNSTKTADDAFNEQLGYNKKYRL